MSKAEKRPGGWRLLSLLGMTSAVMVLNNSSVNVSVSALVRDLSTNVSTLQAVLSLCALVTAVVMLPGAKLADRFGVKRIYPVGAVLYGCGALLVAAAQNGAMLLVGMSLVQGIAAGLMMPSALALLSAAYPGARRPRALAMYSAVMSVSMALAPLLAGALTTYLSWRLVFALEACVVAAALMRLKLLKEVNAPQADPGARFDILGAVLAALALASVILGALLAKTYGWFRALRPFSMGWATLTAVSPTVLLSGAGAVFALLLVLWLWRAKRMGRPVLIDLALFKSRAYDAALLVKILAQVAMTGMLFAVPVYLQNVLQYSALATGVSLLPLPVMLFVAALLVVRLAAKVGRKAVIAGGALLLVAGALLMGFAFRGISPVSGLQLLPSVALLGAGMGCIMSPSNALALSGVAPALANQGSAMLTTANNLASSLGTAITGSLLLGGIRSVLEQALQSKYPARFGSYTHEQLAQKLAEAADRLKTAAPPVENLSAGQLATLKEELLAALNTSMAHLMLTMAAMAALAVLAALLALPRAKKR